MKTTDLIEAERQDQPPPAPPVTTPPGASPQSPAGPRADADAALAAAVAAQPPRPSRVKRVLPLVGLILAGAAGWFGYHWWTEGRFMVSTDDAYIGADAATLAPKVAGHVAAVPVEANQRVKAGEPVVVLDDGDYRLALDAAEAKLATQAATVARIEQQIAAARIGIDQAKAQLAAAVADRVYAEADQVRAQQLFTRDVGAKASLDKAIAERDRARAMERNAKGAQDAAEVNVEVLQAQRDEAARVAAELRSGARPRPARPRLHRRPRAVRRRHRQQGGRGRRLRHRRQAARRRWCRSPTSMSTPTSRRRSSPASSPAQTADLSVDAYPDRDIEGTVESLAPALGRGVLAAAAGERHRQLHQDRPARAGAHRGAGRRRPRGPAAARPVGRGRGRHPHARAEPP